MATKKTETVAASNPVGRTPSAETLEFRKTLKRLASRKNGVTNIEAATEMGITTLKASALANQLIVAGEIEANKAENGRVTYTKIAKVAEAA